MGEHARLSPSGAEWWSNCPGGPAFLERGDLSPGSSSIYADEGTFAHLVRSECLELGLDAYHLEGMSRVINGQRFTCDRIMANYIQPGLDRIRDLGGELFIEQKVSLDPWIPDSFGTMDAGIVLVDEVIVDDFKYGEGEPISPVENKQALLYALGFWNFLSKTHATVPKRFRVVIDQPRAAGGGGEWEITLDKLLAFGEQMSYAAKRVEQKNPPLVPGEKQCRWCPAKTVCPAHAEWNLRKFALEFDDLSELDEETPIPRLTLEQQCQIVLAAPVISRWMSETHEVVMQAAQAGKPTPGLRLGYGRKGNRAWKSPLDAEVFLLSHFMPSQAYTQSPISPSTAEKLLTRDEKKLIEPYVSQADVKPMLVSEASHTPKAQSVAESFDDLTEADFDFFPKD